MQKGTFQNFMRDIDDLCMTCIGLSYKDLEDFSYRDFYNEGLDPFDVFQEIILPETGLDPNEVM